MIIKLTNLQGFDVLVNSDYIISTQPMERGFDPKIEYTRINVHNPSQCGIYEIGVKETSEQILNILVNGQ